VSNKSTGSTIVKSLIRRLTCPECAEFDTIAEIDTVCGYAGIVGILPDGSIEWGGGTDMDWDSQEPVHSPARYVCTSCHTELSGKQLGIKDQLKEITHNTLSKLKG